MDWLLSILDGCCTIQLWRNISGDNFHPIYEVSGNTLVEEPDFHVQNRYRWSAKWNPTTQSYYARRFEHSNGNITQIFMAREILGLSRNPGYGADEADHANGDTLDNRKIGNLRTATASQGRMNQIKKGFQQRFKCVKKHGPGYLARIGIDGVTICLPTILCEVESAQMYKYAAIILHGKFARYTEIPSDEVPTRERRWALMGLVVEKLLLDGCI